MKGIRILLVLLFVIFYVYVWNATATWASPTPWRDSLLLLTDILFKIVFYIVLIIFFILFYHFISGGGNVDFLDYFANLDTSLKIIIAILFLIMVIRDLRKRKGN